MSPHYQLYIGTPAIRSLAMAANFSCIEYSLSFNRKKKFFFLTLFKTVKMLSSWTWYTIIQLPIYFLWKKWIWRALDFQYLLSLPQELSVFSFGLLKVKRDSLNIQLTFRNFTEACKFNLDTCLAYYLSDIIKSNSKTINTTLEAPNGHIYMFR